MEDLVTALQSGDDVKATAMAREAIRAGAAATDIIATMTAGMRVVGEQFARMEVFLPEMTMAARAMQAVLKEVEPDLRAAGATAAKKGTVVIGTVEGDMHTIGKDIVANLLRCHGFEVVDLGVNVNPLDFVRKAEEVRANAIGASALMTTTMPAMPRTIQALAASGIREKVKVMVGGAPVSQAFCDEIEADGYARDSTAAVEKAKALMAKT